LSELKLRRTNDGVMLPVRLTPKSACDELAGVENFGGEAVEGPRACVARAVPRQRGAGTGHRILAQGGKSRAKQLVIEGDADQLARLIAAKLAELGKR
jgi:uncharacterized protein YggU (UPF0235/DUF167 family)